MSDNLPIDGVLTLFDRGLNTDEIARKWCQSEARVERALHIGLERRRADRQADELARAMVRLADELGANI